jgi:hypothetical protein
LRVPGFLTHGQKASNSFMMILYEI